MILRAARLALLMGSEAGGDAYFATHGCYVVQEEQVVVQLGLKGQREEVELRSGCRG